MDSAIKSKKKMILQIFSLHSPRNQVQEAGASGGGVGRSWSADGGGNGGLLWKGEEPTEM